MPVNDSLLQIRRISETKFEENVLLSVSFASLVESKSQAPHSVSLRKNKKQLIVIVSSFAAIISVKLCNYSGMESPEADRDMPSSH